MVKISTPKKYDRHKVTLRTFEQINFLVYWDEISEFTIEDFNKIKKWQKQKE